MLSRRRFLIALQILFILFCALDSLRAQITEQGFKPYGSFEGGNIDTVNLLNGHLNLHIPILSYPQRGDKLHLGFNVEKTAQIFQPWDFDCGQAETCFTWNYPGQGGIRDGIRIERDLSLSLAPDPVFTYKAHLTTADGGTHEMLPISSGIFTKDGTAYRSPTPSGGACPWSNYVTDRNGVRYTFGCTTPNTYALEYGWFEDPNGNKITENYDTTDIAKPLKTITDTMGRTIPFDYSNPPSGQTSNFAGCTGTLPTYTAYLWIVPTLGGGTQTYKSCYALLYINPPYDDLCSSDPTWCYPPGMQSSIALQSLVLPNGTTWTFQYDSADPNNPNSISYGDLLKITFPTGGSLSYTWHTTASQFDQCETSPSSHAWPFARTLSSRTLDALNGTPGTWTYTFSATVNTYQTVVKDPNGNETAHLFTLPVGGCHFYEMRTDQYRGASSPQNLLRTITTHYVSSSTTPSTPNAPYALPDVITTTLENGQQSKVESDYQFPVLDPNGYHYSDGNVIAQREYDYGAGAPGPLRRTTTKTYLAASNSNYGNQNLMSLLSSTNVDDGVLRSYAFFNYDEYTLANSGITLQHDLNPPTGNFRGNQTSVHKWLNGTTTSTTNCPISVSNGYLVSYKTYFDTGTVQKATDSCGVSAGDAPHTTVFAYSSTYAGAWPTTITNPLSQLVARTYDYNTGLLTSTTDPNNKTTSYTYDPMTGRPTQIDYPDQGQATFCYSDTPAPGSSCYTSALPYKMVANKKISSILSEQTTEVFDGLGRVSQTQLTSDPDCPSGDKTDTTYDALGHVFSVSNPYCTTSDSTYGLTTYAYDVLGRTTQVTHPDNSTILMTYIGRATQVQDEGNGTRRVTRVSQVDGLGRLASVCEVTSATQLGSGGTPAACGQDISATGFLTTYGYDTLDNLTSVSQSGLNSRTFQYDSLSRLTSGSNPESGTTSYGYDANGNVITKTAPAPNQTGSATVATTFGYDALNRLLSKSYSDGTTHLALFHYDETTPEGVTVSNPVGRLTSEDVGLASSVFSYDQVGRIISNWQCTPSTCGTGSAQLNYTYDLAGDMLSSTNSRGVTLNYTVNGATRFTALTSSFVDANHPGTFFSAAHYNAAGSLLSASLDNVISETRTYDSRLRLASIADGSNYSLSIPSSGGYAPNSDILAANDSVNGNWTYSYDDFNRLSGSNQNSGQSVYSYVYDRFGNRWQQNGPHTMMLTFSGANNRMDGYSYDAAGNLLNDGSHQYFYDAENRLIQMDGTLGNCSTATACYKYDAEGRRVQKATSSATLDYLYDLAGRPFMEINSAGTWTRGEIYVGSRHIATYVGGTTYFIHPDWLGTERARANVTGALCETTTSLPFGDWQSNSGSCGDVSPMHFTGKERDSESGLDDFDARYYSSSMGRFMSPDWSAAASPIPYADFGNPQSLNLYSYVKNNPLSTTDPDGHCPDGVDCSGNYAANQPPTFSQVGQFLVGVGKELVNMVTSTANSLLLSEGGGAVPSGLEIPQMQGSNFIQQAGMGATQATVVVTGVVETGGAAVDAVAGRLAGAARTTESVGSAAEGAAGRAASVSDSVPATGPGRPSAAQQGAVNEIGNQTGCHTCGATNPGTKSGNWVADHQPPSALNPSGGKQVLKPQCLQCSRQQGGQVAAAVKKVKRVPQSE